MGYAHLQKSFCAEAGGFIHSLKFDFYLQNVKFILNISTLLSKCKVEKNISATAASWFEVQAVYNNWFVTRQTLPASDVEREFILLNELLPFSQSLSTLYKISKLLNSLCVE